MCFSNLPVAFDDRGNPYLADDAEDVDRPGPGGRSDEGETVCEDLATDPERAYEAIVASLPDSAREHVEGSAETTAADCGTRPDATATERDRP